MSGIVLSHSTPEFEEALRNALGRDIDVRVIPQPLDLSRPAQTAETLVSAAPEVVAFGPLIDDDDAIAMAHALDRSHPEVSLIIVTKPTPALWAKALRAGVRDIITPDTPPDAVTGAFTRAVESSLERKKKLGPTAARPATPSGKIITVLSPKGGSGKTMIASNLATVLAREAPGKVVLVDLDVQFGDVASVLRLTPKYSIFHAVGTDTSDSTVLKGFLTSRNSQLLVLAAPDEPQDAEDVKPEGAVRVIEQLATLFRYVIVDTGAGLDDLTLAVADISNDLIVVGSTDVPCITALRKELLIFDRLGVTAKRHFALNRADARVGLSQRDIEMTTGLRVELSIPSSRAVPASVNQGIPLVESEPRSAVAKSLVAFGQTFMGASRRNREGGGLSRGRGR